MMESVIPKSMQENLIPLIAVILLSLIGVLGDYFLKLAGNGDKFIVLKFFFAGFIIFILAIIGWFFVFKYVKLSIVGVLYGLTSTLALVAVGVLFFHEKLSFYEIIGIIFGIISFIFLVRFM